MSNIVIFKLPNNSLETGQTMFSYKVEDILGKHLELANKVRMAFSKH